MKAIFSSYVIVAEVSGGEAQRAAPFSRKMRHHAAFTVLPAPVPVLVLRAAPSRGAPCAGSGKVSRFHLVHGMRGMFYASRFHAIKCAAAKEGAAK